MKNIAIIGLGYVGCPLAVEFGKYRPIIGFDTDEDRIRDLEAGHDRTRECSSDDLKEAKFLKYSSTLDDLHEVQIFIVTVPTPILKNKHPDLSFLLKSSEMIGQVLKKDDIIIYESTVYPGVTEDECVPVLERTSGLKFNADFFCGYCPERSNPGDKEHRLTNTCRIVSGSTPAVSQEINSLYGEIIKAGTFIASSIRVAEAAKVVENVQRDLNIALVNELSQLFHLMNIDTNDVLEAARTKWNFSSYRPGLVGGHCVGVNTHYLIYKAYELNYNPDILVTGRRKNDTMGQYIAIRVIKIMSRKNISIQGSSILILGITFKENCPDIRNSKVIDIVNELKDFGCSVDIVDTQADPQHVYNLYGIRLKPIDEFKKTNGKIAIDEYDAVIIAVAHREFQLYDFSSMTSTSKVIYDVKGLLPKDMVDERL
ncbi:unnamed protein product [Rotaria sp. Silwood1]|nr:unnamed protein product [Rotaria sp. Silwood1]CAF5015844.1 unnamed protein product [Rotaria sp. Silwood1]